MYSDKSIKMLRLVDLISLSKIEKRAFLCIFSIVVLSLLSLIQADTLYMDDMFRVLMGVTFWENDGRPLASLASQAIQLGQPLTDVSPLPQILALALYSLSAVYLGKVFEVNDVLFLSLCGVCFALNPFNLQNFCYIFDSFTMGLAVLTATISVFLLKAVLEKNVNKFQSVVLFTSIFILLLSTLCLYQFGSSVYIGATAFYLLAQLSKDGNIKKSIQWFIVSSGMLLLSLLAYIPVKNFYAKSMYVAGRAKIPALAKLPTVLEENLLSSVKYVHMSLGKELSFILCVLLAALVTSVVVLIFKIFQKKEGSLLNILRLLFVSSLALFYCFLLPVSFYGLSLIFENPTSDYEPRFFMGVSTVVGSSCLFLSKTFHSSKLLRFLLSCLLALLCLFSMNVSLTLGNALQAQNDKEEVVTTSLLSDLETEISKVIDFPEVPKIAILGQLSRASFSIKAFEKYPILNKTIPFYLEDNSWHGHKRLQDLGLEAYERAVIEVSGKEVSGEDISQSSFHIPDTSFVISRRAYDVYLKDGDTFIVLFR
ncbi:MAG: glucosyltransferase domain-containing protein [Phormidesmis sp.]